MPAETEKEQYQKIMLQEKLNNIATTFYEDKIYC